MAAQTQSKKVTNAYKPYPKNSEGKKESVSKAAYQSTFLPIFQNAETRIKELIASAFFLMKSEADLRKEIKKILQEVSTKLPKNLYDRETYLKGLAKSAEKLLKVYYIKRVASFTAFLAVFNKVSTKKANNPVEYYAIIKKKSDSEVQGMVNQMRDLKNERKGYPYIENYQKELKKYLNDLSNSPVSTVGNGKKPISMWQKAELDIRYTNQMDRLGKLKGDGVKLAYLSSHADCSLRCACWQGELVSLTERASSPQKKVDKNYKYNKSSFLVGEVDGKKVYSLPDIMDVETPYGYNNNIYIGFNCRHHLIPYEKGSVNPKQFTSEEMKKEREISTHLRQMEREIREVRTQSKVYAKAGDLKTAKELLKKAESMTEYYKSYANEHGFAWYDYRIKV